MPSLVESVYRRLLREGTPSTAGLAAHLHDGSIGKSITLYRSGAMLDAVHGGRVRIDYDPRGYFDDDVVKEVVVGYVLIVPPGGAGPCGGAWLVHLIAGPGRGKEMYGLAYAAAPGGRITASRDAVSPAAGEAWAKAKLEPNRAIIQLDDLNDPKTDDPNDDCIVHTPDDEDCHGVDRPQLNWVYGPVGWERGFMNSVLDAHDGVVMDIIEEFDATPGVIRGFNMTIEAMGFKFFEQIYG